MSKAPSRTSPTLSFRILSSSSTSTFSPRLGVAKLTRSSAETIELLTPGLFLHTSRGHVPHLSSDHVSRMARHLPWLHTSFESFLETVPPTPTSQIGPYPLHAFLGAPPSRHILSLSLRDPADIRKRPPNGENYTSGLTVRGARTIDPSSYRAYVSAIQPDIIMALSDIPLTPPPHSQKRTTKSVDRSLRWLGDLVKDGPSVHEAIPVLPKNVLVTMVGGISPVARRLFSESLLGPLEGGSALNSVRPQEIARLDDRVAGYVFELAPLRAGITMALSSRSSTDTHDEPVPSISSLLCASLAPLPTEKLRLAHTALSPHEMLQLTLSNGIDLFDSYWAQTAADWGIALDFSFPVGSIREDCAPLRQSNGRRDVGHNLYDTAYACDFRSFLGADTAGANAACCCLACSPPFTKPLLHSALDEASGDGLGNTAPAFARAYIHHLLHTHEMSAHALLVSHNILVLQRFFAGIRSVLQTSPADFAAELARFEGEYDGEMHIIAEGRRDWEAVDLARGKGRLGRERTVKESEAGAIRAPTDVVADIALGG